MHLENPGNGYKKNFWPLYNDHIPTLVDHNEKDGGMYILPECNASMKNKWLNNDDTKSPNDETFSRTKKLASCLMPVL